MSLAIWQCSLQNLPNGASFGTLHLQAGCAHFSGVSMAQHAARGLAAAVPKETPHMRACENLKIMALEIRTLTSKRLAAIRHVGPYNEIGPAFRELGRIAGPAGLFGFPGAMMVGVYHDDPRTTPHDQLRSAAGLIIPDTAAIPAGLVEEHIVGGTFGVFTHTGSYEGLPDAWHQATTELPATGRKLRSATSYELYLNDPTQVPEAELKTEICLPIT